MRNDALFLNDVTCTYSIRFLLSFDRSTRVTASCRAFWFASTRRALCAYVRHAPRVVEPKQRLGVCVVAALHGVDFQLEFFLVLRDAALASHQRSETQTPQIYAEVAVGNSPPACGERRAAVVARGVEPHHAFEAPRAVVDCVATRFG